MNIKNTVSAVTGTACLNSVESAFSDAIRAAFGVVVRIPADGSIHRFKTADDKAGQLSGYAALHADGLPAGMFGSWKDGGHHTWTARNPVDDIEAELHRQRLDHIRQQRQRETLERYQLAAADACLRWRNARPADPHHAYLVSKGLPPMGLRQAGSTLLIPLFFGGKLVNLQRIYPDGAKRFLSGGRVKGAYSAIGQIVTNQPLYIAEGYATALTLHLATGSPVAAAMNAGNLLPAGRELQQRHPTTPLIVAGDDDRMSAENIGRTKAIEAAAVLRCAVVFPDWPADAPTNLSDFNDLQQWRTRMEAK